MSYLLLLLHVCLPGWMYRHLCGKRRKYAQSVENVCYLLMLVVNEKGAAAGEIITGTDIDMREQ